MLFSEIILAILPNSILILKNNLDEVPNAEFGPESLNELKLAIVCLVKHEIAQPHLVTRSNQNIGAYILFTAQLSFETASGNLLLLTGGFVVGLRFYGIEYLMLGTIANANIEGAVLVILGLLFRHQHRVPHVLRQHAQVPEQPNLNPIPLNAATRFT